MENLAKVMSISEFIAPEGFYENQIEISKKINDDIRLDKSEFQSLPKAVSGSSKELKIQIDGNDYLTGGAPYVTEYNPGLWRPMLKHCIRNGWKVIVFKNYPYRNEMETFIKVNDLDPNLINKCWVLTMLMPDIDQDKYRQLVIKYNLAINVKPIIIGDFKKKLLQYK